jgi:hypothetical protein
MAVGRGAGLAVRDEEFADGDWGKGSASTIEAPEEVRKS